MAESGAVAEEIIAMPGSVAWKEFRKPGRYGVADALQECIESGCEPATMLVVADEKIAASPGSDISRWYYTSSLVAWGTTNGGSRIVVVAHVPNYFSDPETGGPLNIRRAIEEGLSSGAGEMPREDLCRLAGMDEKTDGFGNRLVWVMDYDSFMKWPMGTHYGINEPTKEHIRVFGRKMGGKDMIAINHPLTVPSFGTERRARAFLAKELEKHMNADGRDSTGIWYPKYLPDSPPKPDESAKPRGRLLYLGSSRHGGLDGYFDPSLGSYHDHFMTGRYDPARADYEFGGGGCFMGIPKNAPVPAV